LLGIFRQILVKTLALHNLGYVHGDLQPDHFLFNEAGNVYLLDLALAMRTGDHTFAYKGGLVHFNSPEVCVQLLQGSEKIPLDVLSEVYAAASVVFFLYTGHTSTHYGTDDFSMVPMEERLRCIAAGRRSSFASIAAEPFPELEQVLDWCLQVDRQQRCASLTRAVEALAAISV
jgi:serine/threonine protein kinase